MKRILVPTSGATDWRRFLADPEVQWARGASALEVAVSWECAERTERGLPRKVSQALDQDPTLAGARTLIALPEHKVALKGRGRASQTDVWVLLRTASGYISMAVEGKAGEPFASTLADWLKEASIGKQDRLRFLCESLGIVGEPALTLRYQLFHRTVSALLEAERFGAASAVMLVQSFREDAESWQDYASFASVLGATPVRGGISQAATCQSRTLYLGWVDCKPAADEDIANVV